MRLDALRRVALYSVAASTASVAFLSSAKAETRAAPCDVASLTCSVGTAPLRAQLKNRLPTVIDSGMMDQGLIKLRTRFTIDPLKVGEPLLTIDMPKGALVEASWAEKGFVNVRTVTGPTAQGTLSAHYTLVPSLEASIYGVGVSYNAEQLVNKVQGAQFHYDAKASTSLLPWGFAPTALKGAPPPLDQSTIFSIPFSQLGVSSGTVQGSLSIQASANPTFTYVTKEVRLDAASVSDALGVAKLPVGDDDYLELAAGVSGEVQLGGTLDVRPVVRIDRAYGIPTFGLVRFGFTAVSTKIGGNAPVPVAFENATIHVPLPNVKVTSATLDMGSVPGGKSAMKTVTIDSTGELGGKMTFTSSDPQFTVPSGEVTVAAKGSYDLKVTFNPRSEAAASATITVKSNDPGDPEQTFRVAANGASTAPPDDANRTGGSSDPEAPSSDSGCALASTGSRAGAASTYGMFGLGLGLAALVRRRREAR